MALIKFSDGKVQEVSAEAGRKIWDILNGNTEPSDKEAKVAERVSKIWLNYHNAPNDYIKAHFDTIAPMVVGQWMVLGEAAGDHQHKVTVAVPLRPDPANKENVAFSKKWGLYKYGKATDLAKRYM